MPVRRLASAAATIVVAIVCALTVPTAQLRTFSRVTTCCCPDPSHCHCPDHKPGPGSEREPAMRACHRQSTDFVAPVLPAFTAPEPIAVARAERVIPLAIVPLRTPHAPPTLRRPDAPS